MRKSKNKLLIIFICISTLLSCVEPYDLKQENNFDDLLVVEAVLTDEFKFQSIKLSRTYSLDNVNPVIEKNAIVKVIEDGITIYEFEEDKNGIYVSKKQFNAKVNKKYKLELVLSSGKKYSSKTEQLSSGTKSDFDLIASKGQDNSGDDGVFIKYVSINGGNNESSNYYRFDYSSTYKIVSPNWADEKLVVNSTNKPSLVAKGNEIGKVCYGVDVSTKSFLRNADQFQGNDIEPFNLRFLAKNDLRIYHRYSLNVKQFLISREAFIFYKTLEELVTSDNLFSGNQPGLVIGNITSSDENNENVLGYFDVSKVYSKRVFFNYTDFFSKSGDPLPEDNYFEPCISSYPTLDSRRHEQPLSLNEMLTNGLVVFLAENLLPVVPGGPYQVVTKNCGDCSKYGDVKKPDFWID
tara:strand:- start:4435 stop:5658 length:1224 start_codon:yes stop_codon:yes gene_type:complete